VSDWIKVGPYLYNLDLARGIELDCEVTIRGKRVEGGVAIHFDGMNDAYLSAESADAVRRYVAELVAQRKVVDLTVRPPVVSNLDSPEGGP
jgi:hypothetical protein